MKIFSNSLPLVLAAAVAGAAIFALGYADFTAGFRGDIFFAAVVSIAFAAFAIYDYAHNQHSLDQRGRVLHSGDRRNSPPHHGLFGFRSKNHNRHSAA